MKSKILQALKTKYKNLGLSDKVLDQMAATLEATVTEDSQIETAVNGVENLLKSFQSDADKLRQEKTDAEKKLKELEGKSGADNPNPDDEEPDMIPNPKKKKPAETKPAKDDQVPAWAKTLVEANQKLTEKLAAIEQKETQSTQQQRLAALLKDKKIDTSNKQVAFALKGKTFKDDAELEAFADEVAETYSDIAVLDAEKAFNSVGAPTSGLKPTGKDEKVNSMMADWKKDKDEREKRLKEATTK